LASSESLIAITFKKRPEWKIVEWQEKIREKEIDLARADFLPSVWLNGNTYKYKVDYADWSWRFETWVVYGLVSWNIFDGLKTPYRIREAQSGLAAAKFNEVELENLIRSEIEEAQLRFDSEKQRIKLAEQEINLAQEHLTLAREEYRKGIKNNLELLEAQHTLSRAQADLLQAHSDYELAKAKINLVTGAEIFKPL
jgi:outer membrane protein TolC